MAEITIEQQQYRTYVLSEAPDTRLEVVPERGGIVTRWRVRGQEILYLDVDRFANPAQTVRGGIPILFPICGNLPDNTYTHQDNSYTLKQHGFARDLPWTVVDGPSDSVVLVLESDDRTRALYPFEFQLTFTYTLQGDTLITHQRISNRSSEPLPYSIGFHPYFAVSDKAQLEFDLPATEFQDQRSRTAHPYTGTFDLAQDELDLAFNQLSRHSASALDRSRGLRLKIDFSPEFSTLVFWTVQGKDFYCLEPWSAPRNALNTGDRLLHLDPGATIETRVSYSVSFV